VENAAKSSGLEYNKDTKEVLRENLDSGMKEQVVKLENERDRGDHSKSKDRAKKMNADMAELKGETGKYTPLRVLQRIGDNSTEVLQDLGIEDKKDNKK